MAIDGEILTTTVVHPHTSAMKIFPLDECSNEHSVQYRNILLYAAVQYCAAVLNCTPPILSLGIQGRKVKIAILILKQT